jgi:hypothetical protein
MKEHAESKVKQRIAIVLGIIAVFMVGRSLITTTGGAKETDATTTATAAKASAEPMDSLDPRLKLDLLASSEAVKYEGTGKNIFRDVADVVNIPKVKVPPLTRQQQEAAKAAQNVYIPPPPPPINLKFFGVSNSKGEKPKAFLSQGDDIWIAREGDVVNRHYKIVRISPTTVEVLDLLNDNRKTIPLTQGTPG